jgi:TPP-dependent pyruvate/acetoin dehydrogenase alpha subunit
MTQTKPASIDVARVLFRTLHVIRRTEERIRARYGEQEMRSPTHLYIGQEAVATGVCVALRRDDLVFPYYRSHGWYLAKGGDLDAMIAELYCKATGCSRGWGGSMHLIDLAAGVMGTSAIVGGMLPQAAGGALTFQMRGEDRVAVVPFGDGATEEGVFHETMNFASLRKLPLVFVCENNTYATNTHISARQAQPDIHRHAERFGMAGVLVDGNDVLAVHTAAKDAVDRARAGGGPTLLECRTYRFFEHCGPHEDYEVGYRDALEVQRWRERDPIALAAGLVDPSEATAIVADIEAAIDRAFARALEAPLPTDLFAKGDSR